MTEGLKQYFKVGEVVVIQSAFRTARHLWGKEITITEVFAPGEEDNIIEGSIPEWNYKGNILSPPPNNNIPVKTEINWLWASCELKKKYDHGVDFESLISELEEKDVISCNIGCKKT